jgi:hypothetical protein
MICQGNYVIEYARHTAFVRGENWSGTGTDKDLGYDGQKAIVH